MDARLKRADQLAEPVLSFGEGLTQGPPADESVPPLGQTAGVKYSGKRRSEGILDVQKNACLLSEVGWWVDGL